MYLHQCVSRHRVLSNTRISTQFSFFNNQLVLLEVAMFITYTCHDVEHLRSNEVRPREVRHRDREYWETSNSQYFKDTMPLAAQELAD